MNRSLLSIAMLLCACTAGLPAQPRKPYPATMYVIYDGAPLYDSAHHRSLVLEELPLGDSIRVLGTAGKFYRVQRGTREGFLYWPNIASQKPKGTGRKKSPAKKKMQETRNDTAATATPIPAGTDTPSPADSIADSTAAVSSGDRRDRKRGPGTPHGARCRGITRGGGQCSRTATDSSGYCWQHRK